MDRPPDQPKTDRPNFDSKAGSSSASGVPFNGSESIAGPRPSFLQPSENPQEIGKLGGYGILKILGKGGMGFVFLAHDRMLDRQVAVKIMQPEVVTPDNRDRFFREARSTAALQHDHIVPIFQVGEENGVPYLVMPFLQGEVLDQRLTREKKPPLKETLRIIRETATGLMAAHGKGLIHRDIKPGNIWLEAPRGRVRILDFGLARTRSSDVRITQAGAIMGTPAYMSPEQAAGRDVDSRADLFSLGVILYEMLTGVRPFKGNDTLAILTSLLTTTPTTPAVLDESIPKDVSRLAMALIAKDPEKRPSSARDVAMFIAKVEKSLVSGPVANPAQTSTATVVNNPPAGKSSPPAQPFQAPTTPSPPTPAEQDRVFDTKMMLDAIPSDLLSLLPPKSSPAVRVEPRMISLGLIGGKSPPNQVKGDKILIGRTTGSKLRIQSSQVSRSHAQIVWVATGEPHYTIEDLGSTNGTFINDARIKQATPLLPGDQLNFGALGFRVTYPMPEDKVKAMRVTRQKSGSLGAKRESSAESPLEASDIVRVVEDSTQSSPPQNSQPTQLQPKLPGKEEP